MISIGTPEFIVQWMYSFLSGRCQRVKIGDCVSSWLTLNGSMPQGTWFGLYIFLLLINDLTVPDPVTSHKYVDDVTLTEILARSDTGAMQTVMDDISRWSQQNLMNINSRKTKEMLLGTTNRDLLPQLSLGGQSIERVTCFKLLGL